MGKSFRQNPIGTCWIFVGRSCPISQYFGLLRGNRCLFLFEWPQVPDSVKSWNYLLANSIGKKTHMEVGHYRFTYMLSHIGPKYEDLVEIYCHAHWNQPDPNFRLEDVWRSGKLLPLEHPEILYLPPNLPGSTPKEANLIPSQTREETPDLEDINHQELVDLVKELLQERANRPSPTIPNKDIPLAGHVTGNQESFVQSSQAILQGLAEGGYIHAKTPKFECFFGDDKKNKLDFDMWERQILSAATSHSGAAIARCGQLLGNRQNTQPQQIPQFVPQPVQDNSTTLAQASQNQNPAHPQGGRGGRGGFRCRGGRGRGGLILCYWCRDFLPKEQANHKVANCPYQSQARDDWWKSQLGNVAPSPVGDLSGNTLQEDKKNCSGELLKNLLERNQ